MTRREIHEKFRLAQKLLSRFKLTASPIYLDFLRGRRELQCAAWANPTFNVRGCARTVLSARRRTLPDLPPIHRHNRLGPPWPGQ